MSAFDYSRPITPEDQTRTPATEDSYRSRALSIIKKYMNENKGSGEFNNEDFLLWLKKYCETIKSSSWRSYRAALVFYIKEDKKLASLADSIKNISRKTIYQGESRTSSQKQKSLPSKKLQLILDELSSRASTFSEPTICMLLVSEAIGLRPNEYSRFSIIEAGKVGVVVENMKATNGRSNGKTRTIWLKDADLDEKPLISKEEILSMLRVMKSISDGMTQLEFEEKIYEGCRRLLWRVNKKLFPNAKKKVTLYSSRHQFSADFKSAKLPRKMGAYLMGHITTTTSTTHYGRKTAGKMTKASDSIVTASEESYAHIHDDGKKSRPDKTIKNQEH